MSEVCRAARDAADADARAREWASDPGHSVLVQAPAGSGKTTVLTERLLRLLATVEEPEEILAITFTRKAAAEMRARLLRCLQGELAGSDPQAHRLQSLAAAALERSRACGWNLPHDAGRLRIQTIDSFNFRLANQLSVTSKSGGTLAIAERSTGLCERAARRLLMEADSDAGLGADVELLFERLDNHWGKVQSLLADMLEKRGHWLRYVLEQAPIELCARIDQSLTDVVGDELRDACTCISPATRALAAGLPGVGVLNEDPRSLSAWKQLADQALIQRGEWRKPGALARKLGADRQDSKQLLRRVIEGLSACPGAQALLNEIRALPAPRLSAPDVIAIQALARVLRTAAAYLHNEFAAAGKVDHTYIAGAAREALTVSGEPTELALRTGLALRHILVDEFQDTSYAQFSLLESLTAGWEAGDGRSLFLVGDPMQSIYQFREAEVGLFLRARARGIGSRQLEPLQLQRNFRSADALIEWSNRTFAQLFPSQDDMRASAVSFTPSVKGANALADTPGSAGTAGEAASTAATRQLAETQEAGPTRPVRIRLFDPSDRSTEITALGAHIRRLRESGPQDTIAILVASRTHAAPIVTELEARQIEVIGVDLVPLHELSIVRDLVSLGKALSHLGDRTAWLAVLRAPWCGASLATLTQLSRQRDSALLWESLSDDERIAHCDPGDRVRLLRVREVLAEALASQEASIVDRLERAWHRLGGPDCYRATELRHARAFFMALGKRVSAREWTGMDDFDSLATDLYAQPQAATDNPVQIMTIHRAKGLEFDHVVVPCLDRVPNRDPEPLLRWLDLPRAAGVSDLIMAPVPVIGDEEGGEVTVYLKHLIARRTANERLRLLYVAATRAKQTLYWSATPQCREDGSVVARAGTLLACLWPAIAEAAELDRVAADNVQMRLFGEPSATLLSPPQPLWRLSEDWTPPQLAPAALTYGLPLAGQSLAPPEFSWVGETRRHIGTIVHAALERFTRLSVLPSSADIAADRELYAYQLRRSGVAERELPAATANVLEALTRTVMSSTGRWILSAQHSEIRSELALTGMSGGRLTNIIIDRSFVDDEGTRWVIDFKTSRHEGAGLEQFLAQETERYRAQLASYVSLARALGPQPVKAALYFPLLDELREVRI